MATVAELKAELKSRGLSDAGRKAELQARLEDADAAGEAKDNDSRCEWSESLGDSELSLASRIAMNRAASSKRRVSRHAASSPSPAAPTVVNTVSYQQRAEEGCGNNIFSKCFCPICAVCAHEGCSGNFCCTLFLGLV